MANIWENTVITNKGIALQAKLLNGGTISITSIKAGSGSVDASELKSQTAVSDIKQTCSAMNITTEENTITVPVLLTNEGLTTGYDLKQIGFYATDPDDGEILYAIAQASTAKAIPSESESEFYSCQFNFAFTFSNDLNITVNIDPAGLVTMQALNSAISGHTHSQYATKESPVFTSSVSMGRKEDTEIGENSFAVGYNVTASGIRSHAEGIASTASGAGAHAEGNSSIASGANSHAEGVSSTSSGKFSHAQGYHTTALDYQHAQGMYNDTSVATAATSVGSSTGTAFVIGNGTSSQVSNSFRISFDGTAYGKKAYNSTGADMAELREWLDGNPDNEDRRGYFVTMDGINIKIASPGDYICGIISAQPCLVGNGDESWMGRYVLDEFGAFVYETFEEEDPETGEKVTAIFHKTNPDYDPEKQYVQREFRPEWDFVGLCGVIHVRDDGTCEVNGFCKCGDGGIATKSERGYRVLERVNDHIVKVLFYLTGEIF